MGNSDVPMTAVINMAQRAGVIDASAAEQLRNKLGKQTVGSIPTVKFSLTELLGDMPDAFVVTGRLLDFMRKAELIGTASAATPQTVNVVMPTKRPDMNLAELFGELLQHPEDAAEIIGLIRNQGAVLQAETKLRGHDWAIANSKGGLDLERTLWYIRHLASDHTQPQRTVDGQWPTTLERALGLEQRAMYYPFTDDPRQVLLVGPDRFGNDWAKLPDLVHEAIIYAVLRGTLVVQNESDIRRINFELFADELSPYLRSLVEEYEQAKARGVKLDRYVTEEQLRAAKINPGGSRPFGGEPERDNSWYQQQLSDIAQAPIKTVDGDVKRKACVLTSVNSVSGDVTLHEVIVLRGVNLTSGDLTGTIYMPPGRGVGTISGVMSADIRNLPWKRLYEKAVELGLID